MGTRKGLDTKNYTHLSGWEAREKKEQFILVWDLNRIWTLTSDWGMRLTPLWPHWSNQKSINFSFPLERNVHLQNITPCLSYNSGETPVQKCKLSEGWKIRTIFRVFLGRDAWSSLRWGSTGGAVPLRQQSRSQRLLWVQREHQNKISLRRGCFFFSFKRLPHDLCSGELEAFTPQRSWATRVFLTSSAVAAFNESGQAFVM